MRVGRNRAVVPCIVFSDLGSIIGHSLSQVVTMLVGMYETAFHDANPILVAEKNLKDDQAEIDRLRGRQLA